LPQEDILTILHAAFRVRNRFFGKTVYLHMLINAKSGLCSEDCSYCSQSKVSDARITRYPLVDMDTLISGARSAVKAGAKRYYIATSGRSLEMKDLKKICDMIKRIKQEVKIEICTSLGILTKNYALELKKAGFDRYNHNLNTSEKYYSNIFSTHSFKDRIQTLQNAGAAGMELCCGALFGMGESHKDIISQLLL
jgi:biotin synthase